MKFYKENDFKETQIGRIPKDWKVVKLEDNEVSYLIKSGSTPSRNKVDYWNGTIPFVTIGDMTKTIKYLYDTESKITEFALKNSNTFLVAKDSILLSMYGTIGKIVINKIATAISQNIAGIIPNRENVDVEFLHYALMHFSFQFKSAKIITLKHLDIQMVKNTKIPLPPLNEQRAIAEILSTVDEAIQKIDEMIAKTERLKKGLMQELLTKGIGHKEFKDTEIGRIPKDWEVVKLEKVIEIWDKYRIPVKEQDRKPGSFPYCGANGIIDYVNGYTHDGEFVLLAEDGGFFGSFENSAYIMRGRFWANNHVHILKAIEGVLINEFLMFYLNFMNLVPFLTGSTRPKLTQEDLKRIPVLLPSLSEQQKIAEILSTVDKKLEIERKEKAKLERIKQGLMDLLLTGKIRVRIEGVK